ncbi:hypothetical protein GIB67_035177 [Kingdonia uniflora]|uniref:Uncharacterized protein n=1 Tax=Kingdonia uniflora TaxID=39325 RepID=A0A7J7LDY4_9MAGN|nr:hypothetical protein GIB67_035177 [Kingdonia uniflora]
MAISASFNSSTTQSLTFSKLNHNRSSSSIPISHGLSRRPRNLTTTASLLKHQTKHSGKPSVIVARFSAGGNGGRGAGGSGGGGGGGGDDDAGGKNKEEAMMALVGLEKTLENLPADLASAVVEGRIPGAIVTRYFELEKSAVFRWLLKFQGFKERLLADDLFLAKVFMECGVGIFTKSRKPPVIVLQFFISDNGGGNGGRSGGGGSDGEGEDDATGKNKGMRFWHWRHWTSDLASVVVEGRIQGSIVMIYFELEKTAMLGVY